MQYRWFIRISFLSIGIVFIFNACRRNKDIVIMEPEFTPVEFRLSDEFLPYYEMLAIQSTIHEGNTYFYGLNPQNEGDYLNFLNPKDSSYFSIFLEREGPDAFPKENCYFGIDGSNIFVLSYANVLNVYTVDYANRSYKKLYRSNLGKNWHGSVGISWGNDTGVEQISFFNLENSLYFNYIPSVFNSENEFYRRPAIAKIDLDNFGIDMTAIFPRDRRVGVDVSAYPYYDRSYLNFNPIKNEFILSSDFSDSLFVMNRDFEIIEEYSHLADIEAINVIKNLSETDQLKGAQVLDYSLDYTYYAKYLPLQFDSEMQIFYRVIRSNSKVKKADGNAEFDKFLAEYDIDYNLIRLIKLPSFVDNHVLRYNGRYYALNIDNDSLEENVWKFIVFE